MRSRFLTISILLFAAVSCIDKDPSWYITWGTEDFGTTDPPPGPEPDTTTREVTPPDGTLLEAFNQDFKTQDPSPFSFALKEGRDDFRYFSGFPSLSENDTDILLLRLDPACKPSECPRLTASGHTFYGSYSLRVRTPDLSRVRKTTDAALDFRIETGDDCGPIALTVDFSSPGKVLVGSSSVTLPQNLNLSAGFQTIGWDWTTDYVRWWILDPSSKEKKVLKEIADKSAIPVLPGLLSISVHHTADAPEYPFETEIDRVTYEPIDDK